MAPSLSLSAGSTCASGGTIRMQARVGNTLVQPVAICRKEEVRTNILELVREYYNLAPQRKPFEPGASKISYAGRVYDAEELVNLVDSSLDFWLTMGPFGDRFERRM